MWASHIDIWRKTLRRLTLLDLSEHLTLVVVQSEAPSLTIDLISSDSDNRLVKSWPVTYDEPAACLRFTRRPLFPSEEIKEQLVNLCLYFSLHTGRRDLTVCLSLNSNLLVLSARWSVNWRRLITADSTVYWVKLLSHRQTCFLFKCKNIFIYFKFNILSLSVKSNQVDDCSLLEIKMSPVLWVLRSFRMFSDQSLKIHVCSIVSFDLLVLVSHCN